MKNQTAKEYMGEVKMNYEKQRKFDLIVDRIMKIGFCISMVSCAISMFALTIIVVVGVIK
jgi:hypothetical protein